MDRGEPTLAPEWLKGSGFSSSSHSDEHNNGTLLRNRLVSAIDHDAPRASSSFRRSSSSNGYGNFGSRHRDRDRYNNRDRHRDQEKDNNLLDNGFSHFINTRNGSEKDTLRRSHSMVSGRQDEKLRKKLGSDHLKNGGLNKVSFDRRDFPTLGTQGKQGVSSFISSGINSLHINTNGWTSALAEVPASVHTNPNTSSAISSNTMGLSMAEALVQASVKESTPPPIPNEAERRKELTLMKLIPLTPQGPKNLVEKSKLKGSRNGDSKPVLLQVVRPDALKSPQTGNLQVLNRDNNNNSNNTSPTAKDVSNDKKAKGGNGGITEKKPHMTIAPAANTNPKPKANGTSRDRINFFNSLRQKAERKNGASLSEQNPIAASNSLTENGNAKPIAEEQDNLVAPSDEERAFMLSLGWNEDAVDDFLTTEEIESFYKKHEKKLGTEIKNKTPANWHDKI